MELKIFWTKFAENELKEIYDYYKSEASVSVAKKLVKGLVHATLKLKKQPHIGQREEDLKEWVNNFRYLIHQHYKIIYWLNKDSNQIEIVDVFDTRQKPEKIKRNK